MAGQRDNLVRVPTRRQELPSEFLSDASTPGDRAGGTGVSPLHEVDQFGSNPGQLRMFVRAPGRRTGPRPLVVCLHGCAQSAASYDAGSGWSVLAERHGFVALFPEQQARNNPNRCFTWYQAGDTSRDSGEALSIRQMIDYALAAYDVDPNRIFVTGLSAGGAMASSLLSGYPDLFAGGAIVAGLPHGSAANVYDAIDAMARGRERTPAAVGRDRAAGLAASWAVAAVGDLAWHRRCRRAPGQCRGQRVTVDRSARGHPRPHARSHVRRSSSPDLARSQRSSCDRIAYRQRHGTWRRSRRRRRGRCGQAGPFHFDVGIASSVRILEFFGITAEGWKADDAVSATRSSDPEQRPSPAYLGDGVGWPAANSWRLRQ